jgi:glutamate racemase
MSKLLVKIAAIVPTSVLFQIHQVVKVFQINKATNEYRKKEILLVTLSATINKGTHAKKIKKVKDEAGQEAHNKMPLNKERPSN